jgi:hypothetical protein
VAGALVHEGGHARAVMGGEGRGPGGVFSVECGLLGVRVAYMP